MKQEVKVGQTDYTVLVLIRDTAGAPKTALTEASIDLAYARVETDNDVTTTDVTPAALSALTDAHTDWGFEEVSATDHPGLYRLDIADAVFASGAWSAVVTVTGTGLDPTSIEFVLVPEAPGDGVKVASFAAGAITAAAVATGAIDADALAADAATEIADAVLSRDLDQVEGTAPIHSLTGAALKLVSKVDDDGAGSLVTYRTDGSTAFSKQAITTGPSLEPIDSLGTATTP